MESGAGSDIQNSLGTAFLELFDEEIAFALVPRVPVDEFVPLVYKALDVFLLIMVGITDFDGIFAELLRIVGFRRAWLFDGCLLSFEL
jgi:hypothetical protein